ncbi:hypothetical protein NKI32_16985 [Mesorhizobium sp. M0761]|uniref:hypothetical protein n=1 Tax=Mesorhizobium sp. M0761 TaxID=2956994 RepID=UPI003339AE30
MLRSDREPVLAGALNGKIAFARMIQGIDVNPETAAPLFLDFRDVQVATASYLRESVFSFKSYLRLTDSKFYAVAANVNESVYDEFQMVADAKNDAILSCQLSEDGHVFDIGLVGKLDPKQQITFDLVNRLREADANTLKERFGETEKTTAWNNRLAGLAARGLIREFSKGRAKYYRPVVEVGNNGR